MSSTIKNIAEKIGVSAKTVSVALNKKSGVSEETRSLILKTARELNYTRNGIARSLKKKNTNTIGVLIGNLWNTFYNDIVRGIGDFSRKNNYNILLGITNDDSAIEYDSIKMLIEKRVDGLIISPVQKDNRYIEILKNLEIPFIFINRHTDLVKCNYVINDNTYGAYLAIDYLIKKGYKKIYCIFPDHKHSSYRERIEGCKKAFEENNLSLTNLEMVNCQRNLDSTYNVTKKNINYNGEKIGLFVWNDQLTVGVIRAITDMELKIPEEVGIIGYDDIEISKFFPKPLTTIYNPRYDIGVKATEVLLKKIRMKELSKVDKVILKPKLIIRETA